MSEGYVKLGDLFVYKIAIELCNLGWEIYESMCWQDKKIMGDQFIRSVDSCAANTAEGYGRYHYLDRIKFYYNGRDSLLESKHWIYLLYKRDKINKAIYQSFLQRAEQVGYELNKFIKSTYKSKNKE